jgi:AraC-like DNA-binding protein
MATQRTVASLRDLLGASSKTRATAAGGVRDIQIGIDHDLLQARNHLLLLEGITVVHGWNRAGRDLVLQTPPRRTEVVMHLPLRGSASTLEDGGPRLPSNGVCALGFVPATSGQVALDGQVDNEVFRVSLSPSYVRGLAERFPELLETAMGPIARDQRWQAPSSRTVPLGRMLELRDQMMNGERGAPLRRLFIEGKILELLALLLADLRAGPEGPLSGRDHDRMMEARERLLARMHDPPTLAELSRDLGTNEFKLKRDFKRTFQETVHAFLLRRRLEQAHTLLRDTTRPIKEIAGAVGYTHQAHFTTAFGKRYGIRPGQLRAESQGRRR